MVTTLARTAQATALSGLLRLPTAVKRRLAGPPVEIDGQRLDLETQLTLALQRRTGLKGPEEYAVPRGREVLLEQAAIVAGRQPIGTVTPVQLGPTPGRRYVPRALVGSHTPLPTLVFIHGGGFIYGNLDSHDAACRFLAERAGVQVIAVDYRLAPESPFPAAYDDCVAAYRWIIDHAAAFDLDPRRVAVGGDSAGGNLAAGVALEAARLGLPLAFQLLVYPMVDLGSKTRSKELFGEGYYLNHRFIDLAHSTYVPDRAQWSDPRASPLFAEIPAGTAPAYVVTAGYDPLRDEGEAYAQRLADAGVTVEVRRHEGLIHGFLNIVGVGTSSRGAVAEIAVKLRAGLA